MVPPKPLLTMLSMAPAAAAEPTLLVNSTFVAEPGTATADQLPAVDQF